MLVPLLNKRGICEHKYSDNTAFYEKRKTFIKEPKSPIANTAHTCLRKGNSSLAQYWAEWDEIYCYPTQQSIQIKWVASLWTTLKSLRLWLITEPFHQREKTWSFILGESCFASFWFSFGGGGYEKTKKQMKHSLDTGMFQKKNILSTIRMNKSTWRRY